MISVLITAYQEAATIGPAIEAFLPQLPAGSEILVVCPDEETTAVVLSYAAQQPDVRHVPESDRRGKPHALNQGLAKASGNIRVLSDGDVVIGNDALSALLSPFADEAVGAVTGRPISLSSRDTKLGYWSHLLLAGAHQARSERDAASRFLLCSGYLFAFRRRLIQHVPEDALAEDAVISHRIAEQGCRIRYAPEAKVFVKYPDNYREWLKQKVRSAGGYAQKYVKDSPYQMRSATLEARQGALFALKFAQNAKERWWSIQLLAARLHLWSLVLWQVRIRQRPLPELWQRVESTK